MRWLGLCGVIAAASVTSVAGAPQNRALPGDASFLEILTEYRSGDVRRALDVLTAWPDARVRKEAVLPEGVNDLSSTAAAALLLTESGMANARFGRFVEGTGAIMLGGWGLEKSFESHSYLSNRFVEQLARRATESNDAAVMDWVKSWYILASSYCLQSSLACSGGLLEKGLHFLGSDDPEVMLWRGSMAEEPWLRTRAGMKDIWSSVTYGQEARWWYRKALNKNPMQVEARLRLGRSLYVTQNDPDASEILTRALMDARQTNHVFAGHLAALTLGEIREDKHDLPGAIAYYRQAVEIYRGHTASVALGQALVRSGQRAEGWEMGRLMFGTKGPGPESLLDPFVVYRGAQFWQGASRVAEMRKAVRTE